jgi:hypothetical protein
MDQLQERVERYKRFRQIGMEMNRLLVRCLPKGAIQQGARQLGMWENGTVVFETEDEAGVLMDHCLHVLRENGRNAIERYLAESPLPEGSDERIYLEAHAQSHYSMFSVARKIPGAGIEVYDLLAEEDGFLFDIAFSHNAQKGSVIATRYYSPKGIRMTTGTPLPVDIETMGPVTDQISLFAQGQGIHSMAELSQENEDILATMITRTLLAYGASSWIRYQDVAGARSPADESPSHKSQVRIGRNQPCPCGSGKLFKRCCGAS